MLGLLVKRKLDANKMANVFVNGLNEAVENGFADIQQMINEDNAFIINPGISQDFENPFLLILLAGNLKYLPDHFDKQDELTIRSKIIEKFALIFNMDKSDFERIVQKYESLISRVNHPSKNILYGMSKAIFHKFKLNSYQEDYFKNLNTPNPLFLKRMDEIILNFIWDWDEFFKRHKLNFN